MPTLSTRPSMPPKAVTVSSTRPWHTSASLTSPTTTWALPPSSSTSLAVSSAAARSTSAHATAAPSRAASLAMARPLPIGASGSGDGRVPAPTTRMRRPARRPRGAPESALLIGSLAFARSHGVTIEKTARDHQTLDLVCAFADDHQRRIAVVALDRELGGVAVAPVDAHGFGRTLERCFGREELGHARFDVAPLARLLLAGRALGQQTSGLQLGRHVGQLELDRLVLGDGHAERLALLRVGDGGLEGCAGDAARAGRDVDPAQLERPQDQRQAS